MGRKSEIIVIKCYENKTPIISRIKVELPWHTLINEAMGYMGNNVIYDISGVLYTLEKFKEALISLKNNHDSLSGKLLFDSQG